MLIDFDSIEETPLVNFKNGEGTLYANRLIDENCTIMRLRIEPGNSIGMHTHVGNYEIVYVLEGCASVVIDDEPLEVAAGQCHYCAEGHTHTLANKGESDLVLLAVVPKVAVG